MIHPLRIFISSPNDVRPERLIAQRVIERLSREFAYHFQVEPVLWERQPLIATEHFQTKITPPSRTDIVVVILWSRLGTPLPPEKFHGAITGRPVTGTEWEFEDAVSAYRELGKPHVLLYRKRAPVMASLEDEAELERQREQKRLVEDFMARWFGGEGAGSLKAASHIFTTTAAFEEMIETHLRNLIHNKLDRPEAVEVGIHWHRGSPFQGLEPFEVEHAPIFFGRTRARNELREALVRQAARGSAFVLVLGATGSGKSSLVKAGLLADLILPGMVEGVGLCRYAVMRPSDAGWDLFQALSAALLRAEALPELADLQYDPASLAALLWESPGQALLPIRQGLARAGEGAHLTERAKTQLALVVDQLEELFTLGSTYEEARRRFIAALAALARSGLVWVVATMRSDFFDRLEIMPTLADLTEGEGRYLLMPPTHAEIGQIIRGPAREAGLQFEVQHPTGFGLDEVLLQAASQDPRVLPLLEFVLDQLWQQHSEGRVLTYTAYRRLGGLEGALSQRAEEIFHAQSEEVQAALPSLLRALVTVGQGEKAEATARTAPLNDFPKGTPGRRLVEAFLEPSARLLVAEGDDEGGRVRVAHEALLSHWERAARQIEADWRDLQVRARLEQAASLWRAAAREYEDSLLLRPGLPLMEAQDLHNRRGRELGSDLINYIQESKRAYEREMARQANVWGQLVELAAKLPWVSIWTRPRATMRAILDNDSEHTPIVLAMLSGILFTLSGGFERELGGEPLGILFRVFLAIPSAWLGLYIGGGLFKWTGEWIGGQASAKDVRAALGWSNLPFIAEQFLGVLLILAFSGGELFRSETPPIDVNPLLAAGLIGIGICLRVWGAVISLKCLGEVQKFSAWKALANFSMVGVIVAIPLFAIILVVR